MQRILFNCICVFMAGVKLLEVQFKKTTSKVGKTFLIIWLFSYFVVLLSLFLVKQSLQVQAQYGAGASTTSCANITNQKNGSSLNLNSPIAGILRVNINLVEDVSSGNLCFSTISLDQAKVVCESIPGSPLLLLSLDYSGDLSQDSIGSTTINSTFSQSGNLQAGFCRSPFAVTTLTSTGGNQYSSTIPGPGVQVYVVTGNLTTVRSGLEDFNWWPVIAGSAFLVIGGSYTYIAYKVRAKM